MTTYTITSDFKIIVIPNEYNKLVKEDTVVVYKTGETISDPKTLEYKVLSKADKGELIPEYEFQIIATVPAFTVNQKTNSYDYSTQLVVDISDFSELEGDNDMEYAWLIVNE